MADDRLELIASVKNLTSGPIRDIQRSMRALAADTKLGHQQGISFAKDHASALSDLRRQVVDAGVQVRGVFTPALAAMGVSALSAAAGIAAIKSAVSDFADSARHLSFLTRETGLSIDALRTLEALAPRIGTSAEQMGAGLAQFSEHMNRLRRVPLLELKQLRESLNLNPQSFETVRRLVTSLQGLPREQQLGRLLGFLDKIKDVDQKQKILAAFGLPREFANLTGKELQEAVNKIKEHLGTLSAESVEKGKKAEEGFDHLREAIHKLREEVGAGLAGDMATLTNAIADFVHGRGGELVEALRKMADGARDFVTGLGLVRDALDSLRNSEPVDLTKLINFAGLDKTLETFTTTWRARWEQFKASIGLGDQGRADALEAERRRLLKQDFPDQFEKEERDRREDLEKGPRGGLPFAPRWPVPQFGGNQGDKDSPTQTVPLWRRLFNLGAGDTGIKPASFQMPGDWKGALNTPGTSEAGRMLSLAVEKGTYDGLMDFARGQSPGGGGGGGGSGSGIGAIKAAYQPGGGGGFAGLGGAAGEPAAGGGAGVGGGPASNPMGSLGGKPVGVTQLGGGLNRDAFNKMFSGTPLAGHADDVVKAARENGVSPSLMAGIMAHETGKGTSAMLRQKNNPAGIMSGSTGKSFGSIGEGIAEAGRVIGRNFRRGGGTIEGMAKSYAPVGAANDPGGLNAGWPAGVRRFSSQLEGGSATPPRFGLGDIKTALAGSGPGSEGGALPASILQKAQEAALAGGGPAVQRFMRENGYPNHGEAWCGEFAASVVHAAGGQPPPHPQVASNWRKWGAPTDAPVPGDVAVRRGVQTGSTGSHVTFVEKVDPRTGTFTGLGGNQGRGFESNFRASQYDFRHSTAKEQIEEAAKGTKGIAEEHAGMHGDQLRQHFGVGKRGQKHADYDLLGGAQRAGLVGAPLNHKVTGSAHLTVDVNAPRGTQAKMKNLEGLFTDAKINRGYSMPRASEHS